MPGGRRARRYSLRLPFEAYSTITYRGPGVEKKPHYLLNILGKSSIIFFVAIQKLEVHVVGAENSKRQIQSFKVEKS